MQSPYSKDCPQRSYECMISTLKKLPWYMSKHITVRQRFAVYQAAERLIMKLKENMKRSNCHLMLNEQLLKRLTQAAMMCPGFSVVQKDNIAALVGMDDAKASMFNQPRLAFEWTHIHTLCPRPGLPIDLLEWYISFIREESRRHLATLSVRKRQEVEDAAKEVSEYFGVYWAELNLPVGEKFDDMTLRELADCELETIQAILSRILRRVKSPQVLPAALASPQEEE